MKKPCCCKFLKRPHDVVAMDYERGDKVVAYNRSKFIVPICHNGHVLEPYKTALCDPAHSEVSKHIQAGNLKVVLSFDPSGNYKRQ